MGEKHVVNWNSWMIDAIDVGTKASILVVCVWVKNVKSQIGILTHMNR